MRSVLSVLSVIIFILYFVYLSFYLFALCYFIYLTSHIQRYGNLMSLNFAYHFSDLKLHNV